MTGSWTKSVYQNLSRKKTYVEEIGVEKDKFKRVLNVVDLTALGTGSTLGCGVYVLAGTVAKSVAGPAVVLSFILAATVSSFSGLLIYAFYGVHNSLEGYKQRAVVDKEHKQETKISN